MTWICAECSDEDMEVIVRKCSADNILHAMEIFYPDLWYGEMCGAIMLAYTRESRSLSTSIPSLRASVHVSALSALEEARPLKS